MPSMHSRPIRFTVSKRLKHVRLFKSNQRLTRLFRCIFPSVKNKKLGGKGLRVDECANPDRPDWCLKWSAHLDGLKRPSAKRELNELTSASCTLPERWVYLWILITFYSSSLHWCLSRSPWSLKRVEMARFNGMDRGSKRWRFSLLYNYSVRRAVTYWSFMVHPVQERCVKDQLAVDHNKRLKLSRWRTQCKSGAILCPLIFWNVIVCVTKWWTNPNVGLATQIPFKTKEVIILLKVNI